MKDKHMLILDTHAMKAVMSILILSLIAGCGYGKIRRSDFSGNEIRAYLDEKYDRFEIAFSGKRDKPAAIRFDPKDDDVVLTGEGWYPVESKDHLYDLMAYIDTRYGFWGGAFRGPYLFVILDASGNQIGYYYSILDNTIVRPDGSNYMVAPITESDISEQLRYPSIAGAGG